MLEMFEILLNIVDWKVDNSDEWVTETECTTVRIISERAHALLEEAKNESKAKSI
jgi:hypothetical protein